MIKILVAFFTSVLSGLGVGGGGLFVIYLALFTDTEQVAAQGMNLLFFLFSSGSSVIVNLTRRKIYKSAVLVMALFGVVGTVAGTLAASVISSPVLRKAFGLMLMVSGVIALKNCTSKTAKKKKCD